MCYCYHWASVVRLSLAFCILINSSKTTGQFEPNFNGIVLGWSPFRIVSDNPPPTKMAAVTKNRKFGNKSPKNYLIWNCWVNWAQTMVEWSSDGPLCVRRSRPQTKIAAVTKNRKIGKKSLKNYLFWNYCANWAQAMVEWSFGGHLSELCQKTPAANQDGHRY